MIALADVNSFCRTAASATSTETLFEAMQDITARMGFSHFALVHHVDVRGPDTSVVRIIDYPREWIEIFEEQRLFAADPIHRASQTTAVGFQWAHVSRMINLSSRDEDVLVAARKLGIGDGFTVPAHIPGEMNGSCSFAAASSSSLNSEQLPLVQLVGTFAFEAARRLSSAPEIASSSTPRLTVRQLDCVALVARGKTDWEIATILGVGTETVTQHLKDARDRYGVTKRTMLAVRALFDGAISFTDVLR